MYDEKGSLDTFILKKDNCCDFQLYTKSENNEAEEDWSFGIFLNKDITFEIVEEVKIPDEVKNALKTLSNYCDGRGCESCALGVDFGCKLEDLTVYEFYRNCVGGGEDE